MMDYTKKMLYTAPENKNVKIILHRQLFPLITPIESVVFCGGSFGQLYASIFLIFF